MCKTLRQSGPAALWRWQHGGREERNDFTVPDAWTVAVIVRLIRALAGEVQTPGGPAWCLGHSDGDDADIVNRVELRGDSGVALLEDVAIDGPTFQSALDALGPTTGGIH